MCRAGLKALRITETHCPIYTFLELHTSTCLCTCSHTCMYKHTHSDTHTHALCVQCCLTWLYREVLNRSSSGTCSPAPQGAASVTVKVASVALRKRNVCIVWMAGGHEKLLVSLVTLALLFLQKAVQKLKSKRLEDKIGLALN